LGDGLSGPESPVFSNGDFASHWYWPESRKTSGLEVEWRNLLVGGISVDNQIYIDIKYANTNSVLFKAVQFSENIFHEEVA
jgi:hypothetical protein